MDDKTISHENHFFNVTHLASIQFRIKISSVLLEEILRNGEQIPCLRIIRNSIRVFTNPSTNHIPYLILKILDKKINEIITYPCYNVETE